MGSKNSEKDGHKDSRTGTIKGEYNENRESKDEKVKEQVVKTRQGEDDVAKSYEKPGSEGKERNDGEGEEEAGPQAFGINLRS